MGLQPDTFASSRLYLTTKVINEWKNKIMLYKTPIHVVVYIEGSKTYALLSRFPLLFWS